MRYISTRYLEAIFNDVVAKKGTDGTALNVKSGADGKCTPCLVESRHERTLKEHDSKRNGACCNGDYSIKGAMQRCTTQRH